MTQPLLKPSENTVTSEDYFWNRRSILKAFGLGMVSMYSLPKPLLSVQDGFPSRKNPDFNDEFDGLTEEKLVTNYNNFYEFSMDKGEVANMVKEWNNPPQTLEVGGMVHNPQFFDSEKLF